MKVCNHHYNFIIWPDHLINILVPFLISQPNFSYTSEDFTRKDKSDQVINFIMRHKFI